MIFNMTSGKRKTPVLDAAYPADVTVNAGAAITCRVSVAVDGYPASYTYQWYRNGDAVAGATGPTWVYTPTTTGPRTVSCTVTNAAGTVTSRTATLTVQKTPVLNSNYPADITVVKGTPANFQVSIATAGYPDSYTYEWYVDVTAFPEFTGPTFTWTCNDISTHGIYCKVTNAAGTVTSRMATLTATNMYLYNAGDLCTPVTGGWVTTAGDIAVTYQSDSISFSYSDTTMAGEYGCLYTVNQVDLTNFATLSVTVNVTAKSGYSLYLLVSTDNTDRNQNASTVVAKTEITSAGSNTWTLDVSALTGSYYVGFYWDESEGTIHEISLS